MSMESFKISELVISGHVRGDSHILSRLITVVKKIVCSRDSHYLLSLKLFSSPLRLLKREPRFFHDRDYPTTTSVTDIDNTGRGLYESHFPLEVSPL